MVYFLPTVFCLGTQKDPERAELVHRKFGKMMKIVSPITILFGILLLLGLLS